MRNKNGILILLLFTFFLFPILGTGGGAIAQANSDFEVDDSVSSSAAIIKRVEQLAGSGDITDSSVVHSLKLHLMAVGQFEEQDKTDKVVKHMNGFKSLVEHQHENELISEKSYQTLHADAEELIRTWDSLKIV